STKSANIYYKNVYFSGDSINRTYLGLSELGYTSYTQSVVGVTNAIQSLDTDLFSFDGIDGDATATTTTKGFHMENIADATKYVSGNINSLTGYTTGIFVDRNKLKFTLAFGGGVNGGFDGFDKYLATENLPYAQFV